MGGAAPLLGLAAALGAAGVAVLRHAWSRPRRSAGWNAAGWGLLLAATVAAAEAEGAWGIAVAAMATMAAALVALAAAGIGAPPGRAAASNRRVGLLPETGEPRRLGRRFGTFALVIVAGLIVAIGLALAVRGLGGLLGWHEANSNALALFAVPVLWGVLCTVLLMQPRRRDQLVTLLVCSLPVLPVLVSGALS
jgi:hypothetical protein